MDNYKSVTDNPWINQLPSRFKLWFDTDIGNDIDDVMALLECVKMVGSDRLLGVSTTFYKPDQKARIARTILDEFQCRSVPVYAGIGIYQPETEGDELLKSRYGPYPVAVFKKPWSKESLSVKEAVAYKKNFPKFDSIPFEPKTAEAAMRKAIESCSKDGNLIILGIGFTSNIAAVMDAIQSNNVNRIVLMGGWFEDDKGEIKRVGYNTVVDLQASKRVLEQKNVPVLIVNSDLCKKFFITRPEIEKIQSAASKPNASPILCAIADDLKIWKEGKNQPGAEDIVHIADPLAAYLALHPEEIGEVAPVELEVTEYKEGVDMFSPESKNYLRVKKVTQSNVVVVKSVKNPTKVRNEIVGCVLSLLGCNDTTPSAAPQPIPSISSAPPSPSPSKTVESSQEPTAAVSPTLVTVFQVLFVLAFVYYEWRQIRNTKWF